MNETKKRGRPPKPVAERRRHNQTFRCNDDLLTRLQSAADKNQRSLSEEVEKRIEKSFDVEHISEAVEATYMRNLNMIFGGEDGLSEIIMIGLHWRRVKESFDESDHGSGSWYATEESFDSAEEMFKAGIRRILRGLAAESRKQDKVRGVSQG